ncbi:sigma-54 factor interaction domain-containing protein, partial [Achromobacter insolitus]
MSQNFAREEFDVYVWEGTSDIASRAERCLAGMDVSLLRADAGTAFPPPRDLARPAVALVSVSVMGDKRFSGYDWLAAQGMPVIWVAAEARGRDPRYYPPEYSYTLPLAFTPADLRKLLYQLLGTLNQLNRATPRREQPLIAVSATMQDLLAEAEMYADCRSNVLIHGETGVGKERIARLLHDRAAWSDGPFVAVNCGAIPEGLFEAHFFGHAKGAFTGAIGAHKGYFEQASGGTLFLDEIGDLPLYQQVKLLRVLEQNTVTRLGSTVEVPVDFRLVAATNKDLRALVGQDEFRADLYYRLAVIELRIPNLEQRGPEEKAAIFRSLLQSQGVEDELPPWLLERVSRTRYEGNVRELSNVAERVAIARRQFQAWDRPRIERIFDQLAEPLRVAGA